MKKNGFTITELIIALGVIGIASALMLPTISKIKPDATKAKILSLHTKIAAATEELLEDPFIYDCKMLAQFDPNFSQSMLDAKGLTCTEQPRRAAYNNAKYSGNNKFSNLLYDKLDIEKQNNKISEFFDAESKDGTLYFIEYDSSDKMHYIIIDINGSKGPNKIFDADNTKPDRFRFKVGIYGDVLPNDPLTEAYLANPHKMNDKANDKANATNFSTNTNKKYITTKGEIGAEGNKRF